MQETIHDKILKENVILFYFFFVEIMGDGGCNQR
jgi:hypothetical protein